MSKMSSAAGIGSPSLSWVAAMKAGFLSSLAALALIAALMVVPGSAQAQTASDSFAGRAFFSEFPRHLTASNTNATKEPGEPNHGGNAGGHSLWWGWAPPAPGRTTVTTAGSGFDTLLAVYTGDSLTNLTVIGSQDRGQSNESITFDSRAGQTFAIAIDGYNGATGSATLNLDFTPAPINDDFTNRIVLTNLPVSVTTSNIAATLEAGETNVVAGWSAGASLWWSWTAPVAGRLRLTDEGTTYDALLALVTGSSITNLTTVAEQDRSPFEDL